MNETVDIRFSTARYLRIFGILPFLLLGTIAFHGLEAVLTTKLLLFAVALTVSLVALTTLMARRYFLRLTSEGVLVSDLVRQRFFRWHDIEEIEVGDPALAGAMADMLELCVEGRLVTLLATYERSAKEIAELMIDYRAQCTPEPARFD